LQSPIGGLEITCAMAISTAPSPHGARREGEGTATVRSSVALSPTRGAWRRGWGERYGAGCCVHFDQSLGSVIQCSTSCSAERNSDRTREMALESFLRSESVLTWKPPVGLSTVPDRRSNSFPAGWLYGARTRFLSTVPVSLVHLSKILY
jgi:hypothetical protein